MKRYAIKHIPTGQYIKGSYNPGYLMTRVLEGDDDYYLSESNPKLYLEWQGLAGHIETRGFADLFEVVEFDLTEVKR